MPEVKFSIGKRIYSLASENDENSAKILDLASKLNQKVNEIAVTLRDLDDSTCVILSSILILSELQELKKKYESLQQEMITTKEIDVSAIDKTQEQIQREIDESEVIISKLDLEFILEKIEKVEQNLN